MAHFMKKRVLERLGIPLPELPRYGDFASLMHHKFVQRHVI